jgi:hypothetical protein
VLCRLAPVIGLAQGMGARPDEVVAALPGPACPCGHAGHRLPYRALPVGMSMSASLARKYAQGQGAVFLGAESSSYLSRTVPVSA